MDLPSLLGAIENDSGKRATLLRPWISGQQRCYCAQVVCREIQNLPLVIIEQFQSCSIVDQVIPERFETRQSFESGRLKSDWKPQIKQKESPLYRLGATLKY
jgi:hypothetical protein